MLVVLARLQAQHPVLHHIRSAHAVLAANQVELLNQFYSAHLHAIQRDGNALLEFYLHYLRALACIRGFSPAIDLLGRLEVGILQLASLNGTGPDVLVYRPGLVTGNGNFYAVLARIIYLPFAG
jgi:hypothetical protein